MTAFLFRAEILPFFEFLVQVMIQLTYCWTFLRTLSSFPEIDGVVFYPFVIPSGGGQFKK